MAQEIVIVTRHAGLVQYLAEQFSITGRVVAHATPDDIRGKVVIGVLPLSLASIASEVWSIDLDLPAELRGVELTLAQVSRHAKGMVKYTVRTSEAYQASHREAFQDGYDGGFFPSTFA